jgi:hypothetical protein
MQKKEFLLKTGSLICSIRVSLMSLIFGLSTILNSFAQSPDWLWSRSAGGTSGEISYSVATDSSGNVFVTGRFSSSTLSFGSYTLTNAGGTDIFLVKYDSNGNVLWAKSAGGTGYDWGTSVATDANGNCYVTGYFSSSSITFGSSLTNAGDEDIFLVKYDANGNVLWARSAGGTSGERSYNVATDASGNVFVTGYFHSSTISFGSDTLKNTGLDDIFVVKYDANGNVLWARSAGGTDKDFSKSVATDANGNCYVTGPFWSPSIAFGSDTLRNAGYSDIFLVKYDANGNVLWAKSGAGFFSSESNCLTTDPNGNCFVTGEFDTYITFGEYSLGHPGIGTGMFLVKYDPNGNVLWAKTADGGIDDQASSVATDASGNVFVTGSFLSISFGSYHLTNAGGYDIFLVKYDAHGNVLWAKSAGGDGDDRGVSVATDASGNVFVTGYFHSSTISFGSDTLTNQGYNDMFLAKLSNTPNSINEKPLLSDNMVIYPNPNSGEFTLSFTAQQCGEAEIKVLDILGNTVYNEKCFIAQDNYAKEFNLGKITSGIYILQVKVGEKIYNYKLEIMN